MGKGSTYWSQLVPVYILPGLVGSSLAAFAYDFLAKPRLVLRPIKQAVTHPDPVTNADPAAHEPAAVR
jgi:glycerol uptake facilitator protein